MAVQSGHVRDNTHTRGNVKVQIMLCAKNVGSVCRQLCICVPPSVWMYCSSHCSHDLLWQIQVCVCVCVWKKCAKVCLKCSWYESCICCRAWNLKCGSLTVVAPAGRGVVSICVTSCVELHMIWLHCVCVCVIAFIPGWWEALFAVSFGGLIRCESRVVV